MQKLVLIGLAGAAGTLARLGVSTLAQRWFGSSFPWGTVCVNLIGSFFFGLVFALWRERGLIEGDTAAVLLVGMMGGFTTFSSYINDLVGLVRTERVLALSLNFLLQNVGGVVCYVAGMVLGRLPRGMIY
jgi:CrcB protein